MNKGYTLLFSREGVEEILKRHLGFLVGCLRAGAVIADLFTLDGDGSAVRGFRKRQHIVIGEAHTLPDLKRNSDSPSFAKDTV